MKSHFRAYRSRVLVRKCALPINSLRTLDTLGMAQALADKQTEAISTLRMAVKLAPRAPTSTIHLAELYVASGNRKEAASFFSPWIETNSQPKTKKPSPG
jgi:predicted Zn-dependent protease